MTDDQVSRRALNRALLARQHLLDRLPATGDGRDAAERMVDHLVGLQAQNPISPYVALWGRLDRFAPADLAATLLERRTARIAAMRSTVHLLTSADALTVPLLTARRLPRETRDLPTAELDRITARARALLKNAPLRPTELGALLAGDFPDTPPGDLAYAARCLLSLVQVTPRGVWQASMATTWTTAEAWFGAAAVHAAPDLADPDARAEVLDQLVLRYLAAFGPASVADVQAWSGLTGLAAVVRRLGDRLVHLGPQGAVGARPGRVLLDVPDAPRPDADTPAPVRLLADFDNVLLSHADRTRIVSDEARRRLVTPNGAGPGTVLVDGEVAGVWRLRRGPTRARAAGPTHAGLVVEPFATLSRADRSAVLEEAEQLVRFLAPDAADHHVEVVDPA